MSEVRLTSATGGEKGSKPARFDLIPPHQLWRLAEHYGVGAAKYSDDNYRHGYDWKLSIAALERHLSQFKQGEDIDEETGSLHLIAVAWHAFTLAEFFDVHPDYDTRLKTVDARAMRSVSAHTELDTHPLTIIDSLDDADTDYVWEGEAVRWRWNGLWQYSSLQNPLTMGWLNRPKSAGPVSGPFTRAQLRAETY